MMTKKDHHRISFSLLALLLAGTLASCQSTRTAPAAFVPDHWNKVSKTPPTYFPKGISEDHPTDTIDGYLVASGDAAGTRFFIPARGTEVPTQELIAEAQSTMTPAAQKELARKGRSASANDAAGAVTGGTLILLGGIGKAVLYTIAGMGR